MIYELFDTETGNIIGSYRSQHEALRVLKSAIDAYGASYAEAIVLGVRDREGYPKAIAEGDKLMKLALKAAG